MIIKAVTLFLIAMLVLGMFGKLRLPRAKPPAGIDAKTKKCRRCGSYVLGRGPCACSTRS